MKTRPTWRHVATLSIAALLAFHIACSSDDDGSNTAPTPGVDSGGTDAAVGQPDTGTTTPETGGPALPPGCFAGTPTTSDQFMNACTTADYVIFDNCTRLGLCNGAPLPSLIVPPVDAGGG